MDLENAVKKINHRNWSVLSGEWLSYIPKIYPVGIASETSVSDHLTFQEIGKKLVETDNHRYREEVPSTRELLFWEGTYLLHKASHAIGAAESHANNGIHTWALSSAYQGAMFGIKAIMNMLGISLAEHNNKGIIANVWPEPKKLSRNQIRVGLTNEPEMEFLLVDHRIEQRNLWRTFQRILDVSKVHIWPPDHIKALRKLNIGEFAWQRNQIHYHDNKWICDDLHKFASGDNFGTPTNGILKALDFSKNTKDFSLVLALLILKLGFLLFESIADLTNKLNPEKELLLSLIKNQVRHPIYLHATNSF